MYTLQVLCTQYLHRREDVARLQEGQTAIGSKKDGKYI